MEAAIGVGPVDATFKVMLFTYVLLCYAPCHSIN